MNKPKGKPGRKKILIDLKKVEALAADGLCEGEIAAALGFCQDTLINHKRENSEISVAIKRGKAKADGEVSSLLMTKIRTGDLGAMVWYEKTRKGMTDKVHQVTEYSGNVGVTFDKAKAEASIAEILAQVVGGLKTEGVNQ